MTTTYQPRVTPWEIEEEDFTLLPSFQERIRFLLKYAILAPSGHNTQPWRFKLEPEGLCVYVDSKRRLAIADPDDRELNISIGAALMNLRVAAARFGFSCDVEYNADPADDLRATVRLSPLGGSFSELKDIFPSITKRHTNRRPFASRSLNEAALWKLRKSAIGEQASLRIILDREKLARLAELIASGDRIQLSDAAFRRELGAWIRPNSSHESDGMSGDSFGVPDLFSWGGPWLVKTFNTGRIRGKADARLAVNSAALVLLHGQDTLRSLLEAGELLERFLLTLTAMRVQYSFFNQPVEIPELREELRRVLALPDMPHLLFRIGYADPVTRPMPRRPLETVLVP
ncbi:MAG TPA: nitroreductase [Acidobacteriota bacterium]|nr:nitroreductase [Acidobacteriota bacterium]